MKHPVRSRLFMNLASGLTGIITPHARRHPLAARASDCKSHPARAARFYNSGPISASITRSFVLSLAGISHAANRS
jgi:hypothetical protein